MRRRAILGQLGAVGALGTAGCADSLARFPDCPSSPGEGPGRTVCDGKGHDEPVFLHAREESVPAAGGRLAFEFTNQSEGDLGYGPCFWTSYVMTAEGWEQRRRIGGNAGGRILEAGSTAEVELLTGVGTTPGSSCTPYRVTHLSRGPHLFGIVGDSPDGTETLYLASFRAVE